MEPIRFYEYDRIEANPRRFIKRTVGLIALDLLLFLVVLPWLKEMHERTICMVLAFVAIGLIYYILRSIYLFIQVQRTPHISSFVIAEDGITVTGEKWRKSYDFYAPWKRVTYISVYTNEDDGSILAVVHGNFASKLTGEISAMQVGINNDEWYAEEVEEGPFETLRKVCLDKLKFV